MAERKNLNDELVQITERKDGKIQIALENLSATRMVEFTYTVNNSGECSALPDAETVGAGAFKVKLYPGDGVKGAFAGNPGGWKSSWTTKTPDIEWKNKQAEKLMDVSRRAIAGVKNVLRAAGKGDGEGMSSASVAAVCEQYGVPFVDVTEFPPAASPSLYRSWEKTSGAERHATDFCSRPVPWLRPYEFVPEGTTPALFVGGIDPDDPGQGGIGDCYLIAAIIALSENGNRIRSLFGERNWALGTFTMYHCAQGLWEETVLDQFFPCDAAAAGRGQLLFGSNKGEPNEMWLPFVEKMVAKLFGSFKALQGGCAGNAVQDLSGMPCVNLKELDEQWGSDQLFELLLAADRRHDVMTLSTPQPGSAQAKQHDYEGLKLATGHAYVLLSVHKVQHEGKELRLCCVKNPWASSGAEYAGPFGDEDPVWENSRALRNAVDYDSLNKEADGIFFIEYGAMSSLFSGGYLNYQCDDSMNCVRMRASFAECMPSYVYKLTVGSRGARVITALHQRDKRGQKDKEGYAGIRLAIVHQESGKVMRQNTKMYQCARDQSIDFDFAPGDAGTYVVVAMTFTPEWSGDMGFVLFSEGDVGVEVVSPGEQPGVRGRKGTPTERFDVKAVCPLSHTLTAQVSTPGLGFDYLMAELGAGPVDFSSMQQRPATPAMDNEPRDMAEVDAAWQRLMQAAEGKVLAPAPAPAAAAPAPPPPAPVVHTPPPAQSMVVKKKTQEQKQKQQMAAAGQIGSADADADGNVGTIKVEAAPAPVATSAAAPRPASMSPNNGPPFVYETELFQCGDENDDGFTKDLVIGICCPCVAAAVGRNDIDGFPCVTACCCVGAGHAHAWLRGNGGDHGDGDADADGKKSDWLAGCCPCCGARRVLTEGRRRAAKRGGAEIPPNAGKGGEWRQAAFGCSLASFAQSCLCPCMHVHEVRQLLQGENNAGGCPFNSCCIMPCAMYAEVRHRYELQPQLVDFCGGAAEDTAFAACCMPCALNGALREARVRNGKDVDGK